MSRGKEEEEEVQEEEEELQRRNSFPDLDDDDFLPPIDPQRLTLWIVCLNSLSGHLVGWKTI